MTDLLRLPAEIIHSILVYSRSGPSLNLCCRSLHSLLRSAPNTVRAWYLLASWHHEYEHIPVDNKSDPPRFVFVLPIKEAKPPALMYVLEYCLRFPICNETVIGIIHDMVLKLPAFGNYRLGHIRNPNIIASTPRRKYNTGSWELGNERTVLDESQENTVMDLSQCDPRRKPYLPVSQLPRRLFKDPKKSSTTYPIGQVPTLEEDSFAPLRRYLLSFGPLTDSPPLPDLLLLLRVLLLHSNATVSTSDLSRSPHTPDWVVNSHSVNSHSGYLLTSAVFSESMYLVALLLSMGAEVGIGQGLPIGVAVKSDWVAGLRLLIERDEKEVTRRQKAVDGIQEWLLDRLSGITKSHTITLAEEITEESTSDVQQTSPRTDFRNSASRYRKIPYTVKSKRRRLSDRVDLESYWLYKAVKAEAMHVADYLMYEKGIVPDMKTVHALDRQGMGLNV